jgi:glycerol uptake facilitator-like aquaporin
MGAGCGIVVKGESTAVVALGFFLAVVIVVEAFVPFSGAHFNPVISIVMCLCQVISVSLMMLHIVIQFVAGIAAAYMMKALIPGTSAADCAVTKVAPEWQDGIGT